jgi:hypothetical protein
MARAGRQALRRRTPSARRPEAHGSHAGQKTLPDVICSSQKLVGTFIGTPHPVMTEFVGHMGFDFVCIDAETQRHAP